MGRMETFTPAPPAAISRVLATFDRTQLAGFIAVAIDLLDFADGDTDLEDEPTEANGDELGDPAYLEWQSRGRHKMDRYEAEQLARDQDGNALHEDAEDDDPAGQCDEDEVNTLEWFARGGGPGCTISDPDYGAEDKGEREN